MESVDFRSRLFAFRGAALSLLTAARLRGLSFAAAIPQESSCLPRKSTGFFKIYVHKTKGRGLNSVL
jgi:hypothetical protein